MVGGGKVAKFQRPSRRKVEARDLFQWTISIKIDLSWRISLSKSLLLLLAGMRGKHSIFWIRLVWISSPTKFPKSQGIPN